MLTRLLLAPIRFYRRFLSALKPAPTCRFLPTCSEYAIEAIERRGPIVGLAKAMWRVARCNPLCRGGYDPVERPRALCTHSHPHALAAPSARQGQR